MLRYRGKKKVLDKVKEFDAFNKVPVEYVDSTTVGGTFSVITFFIIMFLIYSEVTYYIDGKLVFKFMPDTDMLEKLRINIDITVAMPCSRLGADIFDSTRQRVSGFGELEEDDVSYTLTQEQRDAFDSVRFFNSYLREEYHSLWQLLWKKGHGSTRTTVPQAKWKSDRLNTFDGCRFHGVLTLNKVAGNFHIIAGKSLNLPRGHIHLDVLFDDSPRNFSHRINRLSFGNPANGIIYPLEGDEKIAMTEDMMYQYFVEVVPTDVDTAFETIKTFQYSVKELERPISHAKGSHGVPGIYIKYDMSALKVRVYHERENFLQFILRLFSVIGGIYIIGGFINTVVLTIKTAIIKKAAPNFIAYSGVCTTHDSLNKPLVNPLFKTQNLSVPLEIIKNT